jgi:hypothetical protein
VAIVRLRDAVETVLQPNILLITWAAWHLFANLSRRKLSELTICRRRLQHGRGRAVMEDNGDGQWPQF